MGENGAYDECNAAYAQVPVVLRLGQECVHQPAVDLVDPERGGEHHEEQVQAQDGREDHEHLFVSRQSRRQAVAERGSLETHAIQLLDGRRRANAAEVRSEIHLRNGLEVSAIAKTAVLNEHAP